MRLIRENRAELSDIRRAMYLCIIRVGKRFNVSFPLSLMFSHVMKHSRDRGIIVRFSYGHLGVRMDLLQWVLIELICFPTVVQRDHPDNEIFWTIYTRVGHIL